MRGSMDYSECEGEKSVPPRIPTRELERSVCVVFTTEYECRNTASAQRALRVGESAPGRVENQTIQTSLSDWFRRGLRQYKRVLEYLTRYGIR